MFCLGTATYTVTLGLMYAKTSTGNTPNTPQLIRPICPNWPIIWDIFEKSRHHKSIVNGFNHEFFLGLGGFTEFDGCIWTTWESWTHCSKTCGYGSQVGFFYEIK